MTDSFVKTMASPKEDPALAGFAIASARVINNRDCLALGRVQVRVVPLPSFEPWCRFTAVGGAAGRGFAWVPQVGDEVLVAFSQHDERDAYIIGGLWSMLNRPPVDATDSLTKRVIKTGLTGLKGHKVEFDDLRESITITSSTDQKIAIDPKTIELTNAAGTIAIKMDNVSQTISISATAKIELKAAQISIEGNKIDLKGTAINIQATGPCSVQGLQVKIN